MIVSLEHHIADHCNLNCAGCSHFSPLSQPWLESFNEFKEEWDRVYNKGLEVKRIRILGGEPLLNPYVGEMAAYARSLFPSSDVNVVTNGILLERRKTELLPIFQENKISITVSRYPGLNIDYQKVLNGFPKIEMYGKASFWNISLHDAPDFDENFAFLNCFSATDAKCSYLLKGRIYPCPILPNIPRLIEYFPELKETQLGEIDFTEGGILIEDHSVEEIEQFLRTPNPICAYCNVLRAKKNFQWKRTNYQIKEWME